MADISNVFFRDSEAIKIFSDDTKDYYERNVAFNKIIRDISMQNLYEYIMDDVMITFFDDRNMAHASWSLNYGDYSYLLKQDWIKKSLDANGFVVWNMAALGYDPAKRDDQANQIALARSIMDEERTDCYLGTLLISINQRQICKILESYKYSDDDSVFASSVDGKVVFYNKNIVPFTIMCSLAERYRFQDQGNAIITIGNNKYLLSYYTLSRMSTMSREALKIFYLTDYQNLSHQIGTLVLKINILCVFFVFIVFLLAIFITKKISDPMRKLARQMAEYKVGDMPITAESNRQDEIGEIYTAFQNMACGINKLFDSLKKEQATREKYYYESLKSKVNPHFLFNTLTSIRWMAIVRKADNIRESIDALASILNYNMTGGEETVPLSRELEIVKRYCYIQNIRFGNSIELVIDVPFELQSLRIIKFILQPTVENCFKHAFGGEMGGGKIEIRGVLEDAFLLITVCDNGVGFSKQALRDLSTSKDELEQSNEHTGIGLRTIDARIRISYGSDYGLLMSNSNSGGACVEYRLPVIKPGEHD